MLTDSSAVVSFITRFTEECFATIIALIYIVEALKKLFHIMSIDHHAAYNDVRKLFARRFREQDTLSRGSATPPAVVTFPTASSTLSGL